MKKLIITLLSLMLALGLAAAEEQPVSQVVCESDHGAYIIRVTLRNDGEVWQADNPAQDGCAVRLAESVTADGIFTARYEAVADGEAHVYLRRFSGIACVECHGFDLKVTDGQIENIGGSYTASPEVWVQDDAVYGEWLEKDTQFTLMDIRTADTDGWDVTITSPLTHGAYRFTCRMAYDCDRDAFVYADGARFDLDTDGAPAASAAAENLSGTIRFAPDGEDICLVWTDGTEADAASVVFERAPALPAFTCSTDTAEGALAAYALETRADMFLTHYGDTAIPVVLVLKTEAADETHMKVWANLWVERYVKQGNVLFAISGGEFPCAATLEASEGGWKVTSFEEADEGDEFDGSITALAEGDEALADRYFETMAGDAPEMLEARLRAIGAYVEANGLPVSAVQDYGWDPIELFR